MFHDKFIVSAHNLFIIYSFDHKIEKRFNSFLTLGSMPSVIFMHGPVLFICTTLGMVRYFNFSTHPPQSI